LHIVMVKFEVLAGNGRAFLERVWQQALDSLEKEPDCHVFEVGVDPEDECRIMLYEIYTDRAAFGRHLESDHFRIFDQDVQALIVDKKIEHYSRIAR